MNMDFQTKVDRIIRIAGMIMTAILILYLPLDSGGFYALAKGFLCISVFLYLSLRTLYPGEKAYPPALKKTFYALVFFLLLSTLFSTDIHLSILETVYFLALAGGFILGGELIRDRRIFFPYLVFLLFTGIISCGFALDIFRETYGIYGVGHGTGGRFFQRNVLGGFLSMLIPLSLAFYFLPPEKIDMGWDKIRIKAGFLGDKRFLSLIFLLVSSILLTTLFLTFSRGAFVSLILVLIPLLFIIYKRTGLFPLLIRLLFLLVFCGFLIWGTTSAVKGERSITQDVKSRVEQTVEESVGDRNPRMDFWIAAWNISWERPLLGYGLGTFGYQYPRYQKEIKFFSKYVHNFYLSLSSGAGFPALIAYLGILFLLAKGILNSYKKIPDEEILLKVCFIALFLGLVSQWIHSFVDVDFDFSGVAFVQWVSTGVLMSFYPYEKEKDKKGKDRDKNENFLHKHPWVRYIMAPLLMMLMFPYFMNAISVLWVQKAMNLPMEEREPLLKNAVETDPLNTEARRVYAEFLFQRKQYDKALAVLQPAIAVSPCRARLYVQRGMILSALGKKEDADKDYYKAIQLDPVNQIYPYLALADHLMERGKMDDALSVLLMVDRLYKNFDMDLWNFRMDNLLPLLTGVYQKIGDIYNKEGNYSSAIENYKKAIFYYTKSKGRGDVSYSYFGIGFALYSQGDYNSALDYFNKFLEIRKDFPYTYMMIYNCYAGLNQKEKGEAYRKIYEDIKSHPGRQGIN